MRARVALKRMNTSYGLLRNIAQDLRIQALLLSLNTDTKLSVIDPGSVQTQVACLAVRYVAEHRNCSSWAKARKS